MKTRLIYEAPETTSVVLRFEQNLLSLSDGSGNVQSSNVQALDDNDITTGAW